MLTEEGERSRSHGLALSVLQKQADLLGVEHVSVPTTWKNYETNFVDALKQARNDGIQCAVFGDIDIEAHRQLEEKVCDAAGVEALLPLWGKERRAVLEDYFEAGFEALIIAVKDGEGAQEVLGKMLSRETISKIEAMGWDACGENGEYHTVVIDGPLFSAPLELKPKERVLRDGYWFLDVAVKPLAEC